MGKNILVQRKGRGNLWARSPGHRHIGKVRYRPFKEGQEKFTLRVISFIHSPGRGAPIAKVKYDDGTKGLWLPPEGIYEEQEFIQAKEGEIRIGNVLPLEQVRIGTLVYNIEGKPGDGGKFARASGVAALVTDKKENQTQLIFRSKKRKWFHNNCLCTIGVVAGGGRTDKPFLKAGNKFYYVQSKAKKWPVVRGVTMNACSHPYGGGAKQSPHKPTTTARNTPPGRKVGQIAAKRTGHRK
ncbi:MAG: 50S ribosomal protein L2 [Candidatus Lokiarchaeota archaeon]|nr:50S ribosomal protein L2 [Candidatus Lokiarchaeota archaeon]MBD3339398.1 50S ribosomal protein L2 [Candidatus Lokiarchaeota archaeon]